MLATGSDDGSVFVYVAEQPALKEPVRLTLTSDIVRQADVQSIEQFLSTIIHHEQQEEEGEEEENNVNNDDGGDVGGV
jgi:hypothetical protein